MKEILDPREEFKAFYILLLQDNWFSTVSSVQDLSKIFQTINRSEDKWEYELTTFVFKNISLDRHIRPQMVSKLIADKAGESRLIFGIRCKCECRQQDRVIKDPIINLGAKFIIQFEYLDPNDYEMKKLQCFWHLDKHDPAKETSTTHPLYHYEYGGTEMRKVLNFKFGDFILLDGPRIMHPPLDIVLAFDFIIKNFYSYNDHRKLTESAQYKRYIKNAQNRIWRPFAISFASHFHDFSSDYEIDEKYAINILHCPNRKEEED